MTIAETPDLSKTSSKTSSMTSRWMAVSALAATLCLGCKSPGMKTSASDSGVADTGVGRDLAGRDNIAASGDDTAPIADQRQLNADVVPVVSLPDSGNLDSGGNDVGSSDRGTSDIGVPDILSMSGDGPGRDSAPDVRPDATLARDLATISDTAPAGQDVLPFVDADAKTPTRDAVSAHSPEAGALPKDTVLFPNQDQGPADAQCVAATPGWLNVVGTFLVEDQKCWADTDCTYVSFSDPCGNICPVPMNTQRIGEFGAEVSNYANTNCGTCPSPATYPVCPAPRAVYCNAGQCEYRAS